MKKMLRILLVGVLSVFLLTGAAWALTINFANLEGAKVLFRGTGDQFTFVDNSSDRDFIITTVSGGAGDSANLQGNISGIFTIGAVTSTSTPLGTLESASVTSSSGALTIVDANNVIFSADLEWVSISTLGNSGGINGAGSINLTNVAYTGSNNDLSAFVNLGQGKGIASATFQFVPAKSLTNLTTDGNTNSTSYSGSLVPVPEPTTMLLLGLGILGIAGIRIRSKK